MTVKELKELLASVPDEMQVLIPGEPMEGFTGHWLNPCNEETNVVEMGLEDLSEEEIKERELLNKPIKTQRSFCIVPCGYFEKHENVAAKLN